MANRLTTWITNQKLTSTALNAEVNNIYIGTIDRTAGRWGSNDDIPVVFGSSQDVSLTWNTTQTQDALVLTVSGSNSLIICEESDKGTDFSIAAQTNPSLFIHSADGTTAADYIQFYHDQTDSVINSGAGSLLLHIGGTLEATLTSSALNLASGNAYQIAGTSVLNATTLGTGVVNSSLTTVGTIATGVWNGTVVGLTYGGTGKALTADNGGIIYSDADSMEVLAATATAGQMLRSGANAAPSWSTATFPSTATSTGTFLRSDGTNWVASTNTIPNTISQNRLLYASAANVLTSTGSNFIYDGTNVTFTAQPAVRLTNASTVSSDVVLTFGHQSTGTAGAGFGSHIQWNIEDASGTEDYAGTLGMVWGVATHGSEQSDVVVQLQAGGAAPAEKYRFAGTGSFYINDTTNANMTTGLTINQGAADNEIIALKSSDVAHGITDHAETDTFFTINKRGAADGGALIDAFTEALMAMYLEGTSTTESGDRTTSAQGCINITSRLKSGAGVTGLSADKNILCITNNGTTKFTFDTDGSAHADVEWVAFDTHDDVALLEALSVHADPKGTVDRVFGEFLKYNQNDLQAAKIANFEGMPEGHVMLNGTRLHMLEVGAIRQLAMRLSAIEAKLNG